MLPTKFRIIWTSSFRGEDFQKSTNQKQELTVVAMFVNGSGRNEHSLQRTAHRCFLPSFGSFGQAASEEKNLKNQPIRNKNRLWRPYLLMDRDEMSSLQRGPSIDAFYQVLLHLAVRFQRRRLKCEKLTDDGCQVMAKAHFAFSKVSCSFTASIEVFIHNNRGCLLIGQFLIIALAIFLLHYGKNKFDQWPSTPKTGVRS